jgi:hypothetical protein
MKKCELEIEWRRSNDGLAPESRARRIKELFTTDWREIVTNAVENYLQLPKCTQVTQQPS